jgi:hemolysin III
VSQPTVATTPETKPRFRGVLHQIAFFVAIPAGLVLVALGDTGAARAAAAVFAFSLCGLYGVSSAYHRLHWSPQALSRMRLLDHSMIFVLIAGSYTAVSVLALRGKWAPVLLAVVWLGAVSGIVLKFVGIERTRHITGSMYIVLGWAAIFAAPEFVRRASPAVLALIAAGGVLYTLGSIVLVRRKPDPDPRVFGYHEIWHSMVVAASACHYAAVVLLITR